jgi:glyoxylase-like metal-dependent hydrolase (beta-lactamase superfamily II)
MNIMKFFSYFSVTGFSNSYLIGPDEGGNAILIDPGIFDVALLNLIESNKLYVKYVLLTHSHESHISGLKTLLKVYDPIIYSNSPSVLNCPSQKIDEGDILDLGKYTIHIKKAPAHSGDSVLIILNNFVFTGDTLFSGTIGSTTDNISHELLLSIIHEKILTLDDEYFIFPGHGPPTKVGIERILNPHL